MKQDRMKEQLHFHDGIAAYLIIGLLETLLGPPIVIEQWIREYPLTIGESLLSIFGIVCFGLFGMYMLFLGCFMTLNYRVTEEGIGVYRCRRLKYYLTWDKVESITWDHSGL